MYEFMEPGALDVKERGAFVFLSLSYPHSVRFSQWRPFRRPDPGEECAGVLGEESGHIRCLSSNTRDSYVLGAHNVNHQCIELTFKYCLKGSA